MSNTMGDSTLSGGTDGAPNHPDSSEQEVKPNSPELDADTLNIVKQQLDELAAHVNSLRGDKDRGVNRVEQSVKKLEERFDALDLQSYAEKIKAGKDDETAMRELRIDHFLRDYDGQQQSVVAGDEDGTNKLAPVVEELDGYFQEFNIDPNAPESIAFIQAGKFDAVSKTKFVMENVGKAPPATAGTILPDGASGTSAVPESMEALTSELQELQKTPSKHIERRKEIMAKLSAMTPRKDSDTL